jgi:hypothetical protein
VSGGASRLFRGKLENAAAGNSYELAHLDLLQCPILIELVDTSLREVLMAVTSSGCSIVMECNTVMSRVSGQFPIELTGLGKPASAAGRFGRVIPFKEEMFRYRRFRSARCSCFDILRYLRTGFSTSGDVRSS